MDAPRTPLIRVRKGNTLLLNSTYLRYQGLRMMFLPADRSWLALFHQLLSFKLWDFQASSVASV